MEKHNCPICDTELPVLERYPAYICEQCCARAADKDGRKLQFWNTGFSGGYEAGYADTKEKYPSHDCYIDGIACYANEARFGGIVIQKK